MIPCPHFAILRPKCLYLPATCGTVGSVGMPHSSIEFTRRHPAAMEIEPTDVGRSHQVGRTSIFRFDRDLAKTFSPLDITLIPDRRVIVRPILSRRLVKSARVALCGSKPEYGCHGNIRLTSSCLPKTQRRLRSTRVFLKGSVVQAGENKAFRRIWRG